MHHERPRTMPDAAGSLGSISGIRPDRLRPLAALHHRGRLPVPIWNEPHPMQALPSLVRERSLRPQRVLRHVSYRLRDQRAADLRPVHWKGWGPDKCLPAWRTGLSPPPSLPDNKKSGPRRGRWTSLHERTATGKSESAPVVAAVIIAALGVGIALGGLAIYLYTSPSETGNISSSAGPNSSSTSQTAAPPAGYQDSAGQPQGMWSDYLGFIPRGYALAPRTNQGATYPCPIGMDANQCQQFQASCGNGVCDPNESCFSCPIDCVPPGQLTCDPYTLRVGSPTGGCQVGAVYPGDTGGGGN